MRREYAGSNVDIGEVLESIKGVEVTDNTRRTLVYRENGLDIAEGEGIIGTVLNYYEEVLDIDVLKCNDWREYPRNTDYEVSSLGFIREKTSDRVLNMSLKDVYEEGSKGVWRLRVTIPSVGTQKVSQVVMETFMGVNKDQNNVVGHKNDVPIDNRVSNLKYITNEENRVYASIWRDYNLKGLNLDYMEVIMAEIMDYLDQAFGEDQIYVTGLTDEDLLCIQDMFTTDNGDGYVVEVGTLTIEDIYKYFRYNEGVIFELETEGYINIGGDING